MTPGRGRIGLASSSPRRQGDSTGNSRAPTLGDYAALLAGRQHQLVAPQGGNHHTVVGRASEIGGVALGWLQAVGVVLGSMRDRHPTAIG